MKLVRIDTGTLQHTAYDGAKRIASAQFTRILNEREMSDFREEPLKFLGEIEYVESATETSAA